jgi:hypothetical protein
LLVDWLHAPCRSFKIFQMYQYFTIYRQYFFLKIEHFSAYAFKDDDCICRMCEAWFRKSLEMSHDTEATSKFNIFHATCKKNPYIINQNHIFSNNYCEVISGNQSQFLFVIFKLCTNKNHSYKYNEQINSHNIEFWMFWCKKF